MGDDSTIVLTNINAALNSSDNEAKDRPACFLVVGGEINGTLFDLKQGITTMGRSVENGIPLDYPGISRRHVQIVVREEGVFIEDLESKNGTFLNNEKLTTPKQLKKGDIVKVGALALKFIPKGDTERVAYDKLNRDAVTDGLTRCYNKTYFNQINEMWVKKSKITGIPLSLLMFDIDHFKKLNDTYGHDAGDFVLKEMTAIIHKQGVREGDLFARYGGEEFVVILPNTNLKQSYEIAERIRLLVAEHSFLYQNQTLQVHISAGVADCQKGVETGADLFKRADLALYKSKNSGRNQVNLYKE